MLQRGAAMSSTAAASGFVVFLLSAQVIQSQDGWGVTYTPPELCAVRGSSVEMLCTYTHPSRIQPRDISTTLWFTEEEDGDPVDLEQDSESSGRVASRCSENRCSLSITNLSESDSAEYKFMFMTNQHETYTGSPGVTLSVTDLQVKVSRSGPTWLKLTCQSSCVLPDHQTYEWYQDEWKVWIRSSSYFVSSRSPDRYSCALSGLEDLRSPSVYGPKLPSVSVSPSEIVEGSSVTLTCSSDANPAANYTWYKEDEDSPTASGQIFIINDFRAEHSGSYSCEAQNNRGCSNSTFHLTVADPTTMMIHNTRLTLVVVVPVSLLLLCLWMRKKNALISTAEPHEPIETVELDLYPVYEDISDMAAQTEDTEEQEDQV